MSQAPSSSDESPVIRGYRNWAATCPFVSRNMTLLVVGSWVVGCFLPGLDLSLSNTPRYTLEYFEVYRLGTSLLSSGGLITMIFSLMTFNQIGPRLESSLGSAGMMALMGTFTVVSNVAFVAACGIFRMMGDATAWTWTASGFWNLLIPLIAVECMAAPESPRRFFIFPFDIPAKYYPLFLGVLFSFMRGRWVDLWCSIGIGYAYATGKLDMLKPSRSRLSNWETGCLANFVQSQGYVTSSSALGAAAWAPLNNPVDHPSNQRREASSSGFASFFSRSGGDDTSGSDVGGSAGMGTIHRGDGGGDSEFGSKNVIKRGNAASSTANGTSGSGGGLFSGSGQTLGSSEGLASRLSGRGQARHDPEAARAARLAAFEAKGTVSSESGSTGGAGGSAPRSRDGQAQSEMPLLASHDQRVLALQDMGYPAAEARQALEFTDGDVDAAVSYLSA